MSIQLNYYYSSIYSHSAAGTSPTIQVPPQTITVGVGQEATLSCSASGDPIPSIQWFFNGVDELVTNADLTVTSMSGSSTLTIHSVQMSNAGLYECRAVNSAGSDSGVANIMVTSKWYRIVYHSLYTPVHACRLKTYCFT